MTDQSREFVDEKKLRRQFPFCNVPLERAASGNHAVIATPCLTGILR